MDELSTPNDINLFFATIFSTLVIELLPKSFIKPFQNFTSCIYILYLWSWKLLKWLHNIEDSNLQFINFRLYIQIVLNPDYIIQVKFSLSFNVVTLYTYKCEFLKLKEISSHNQQLQWAKKMSKWFANVERLVHISRTTDWNKMFYVPLERSAL